MTPEQEKRCEEAWPHVTDRLGLDIQFSAIFRWGYAAAIEREVPRWRPIETAPKDGAEILLFTDYGGSVVGEWGAGYWVDCREYAEVCPTHWQPLPEPPKEGE